MLVLNSKVKVSVQYNGLDNISITSNWKCHLKAFLLTFYNLFRTGNHGMWKSLSAIIAKQFIESFEQLNDKKLGQKQNKNCKENS